MTKDQILETQFVQRAYDGHYEHLIAVLDYENEYTFINEHGQKETITPKKWICKNVYPFLLKFN